MKSRCILTFLSLLVIFVSAHVEAGDALIASTNIAPIHFTNSTAVAQPQPLRIRLQNIVVDIRYDSVPFDQVLDNLRQMSKARDPDHHGINFLIDGAGAESVKSAKITINPGLAKLPLRDALDAITHAADQPITYSVFDYAIVFRAGPPSDMRTYRVDPNTFRQGLQGVTGVPFGNVSGNGGSGNSGGAQSSGVLVPRVDFTRGVSGATATTSPSSK